MAKACGAETFPHFFRIQLQLLGKLWVTSSSEGASCGEKLLEGEVARVLRIVLPCTRQKVIWDPSIRVGCILPDSNSHWRDRHSAHLGSLRTGYLRMGLMGTGQQEPGLGFTRLKLGCSRKVKFFRFPKLCPHRQPFGITLGNLPLRRPGWPEWGGALGSSLAFPLLSGNLWKTKCFLTFPLLGRKKKKADV